MNEKEREAFFNLGIRLAQMQERFPPGFPFDRNGLRLAIASIEDETAELYDEWRMHKRNLGNARKEIQHELLDIAGVALYAYLGTLDAER